jgi:hypothetical protein
MIFFGQFCLSACLSVAVKSLHFERMLAASLFLDVREPNFKTSHFFKLGASGIVFITAALVGLFCTINLTVNSSATDDLNTIGNIAVVTIAMLNSMLFLYTHFTEGALLGFLPSLSFRERSSTNQATLGLMPSVGIRELELAARAFIAAARMVKSNPNNDRSSTSALLQRMGSVVHIFAASDAITQHGVEIMESAAYPQSCRALSTSFALKRSHWLPLIE